MKPSLEFEFPFVAYIPSNPTLCVMFNYPPTLLYSSRTLQKYPLYEAVVSACIPSLWLDLLIFQVKKPLSLAQPNMRFSETTIKSAFVFVVMANEKVWCYRTT